jgi:flagellar basal-body rod protein FlgB
MATARRGASPIPLPVINHTPGKVCLARKLSAQGISRGQSMAITDIPILSMLRTRLDWSQQRQRVLAENVANADTPNYRARDLDPLKFEAPAQVAGAGIMPVALAQTESGHIAGLGQSGSQFRTARDAHYEVRPGGNAVSLEDEMMKVAANQMDYQAVTALYTRSLNLLKTALGKNSA